MAAGARLPCEAGVASHEYRCTREARVSAIEREKMILLPQITPLGAKLLCSIAFASLFTRGLTGMSPLHLKGYEEGRGGLRPHAHTRVEQQNYGTLHGCVIIACSEHGVLAASWECSPKVADEFPLSRSSHSPRSIHASLFFSSLDPFPLPLCTRYNLTSSRDRASCFCPARGGPRGLACYVNPPLCSASPSCCSVPRSSARTRTRVSSLLFPFF